MKSEQNAIVQDKDQLHYEMVIKSYRQTRINGQLQSIEQIFSRLPLPRLEKDHYNFLFEGIKSNVQSILTKQNILEQILNKEQAAINKIELNQQRKLKDVKFAHQDQLQKQKLPSGLPIFKCITYIRWQDQAIFPEHEGEDYPFLPDQKYLDLNKIEEDIHNIRIFLQNVRPLKSHQFEFVDQNTIQFCSRGFPSSFDIQKRAQTLAKLYILNFFRQESRKLKQMNKTDEIELNKQREIKKIKQELEIQKLKEGELIEEMDLIKQAHKIFQLIEKKMNELAFDQFKNKGGDKARQIKKSLQKLKDLIDQQPSAKMRLKTLIAYKHKKGW